MADIPNREQHEQVLARHIRRASSKMRRRIIAAMGEPPNLARVPAHLWYELEEDVKQQTYGTIAAMYLLAMGQMDSDLFDGEHLLDTEQAAAMAAEYAFARSQYIADTMIDTARARVGSMIERGETNLDQVWRESAATQAETAAITETSLSWSAGELEWSRQAAEQGWELEAVWYTEYDSAVCDKCDPLHGTTEEVWGELYPFGPGSVHPRCVLPGTMVEGRVEAASKAFYSGQAIEFTLASGCRLSVTPNHPVLTDQGFVAAHLIREGDNVLSYGSEVCSFPAENDIQQGPALIENVFSALADQGNLLHRANPAAMDFHGDAKGFKGQVEIVGATRKLLGRREAKCNKCGGELSFIGSNVRSARESSLGAKPLLSRGMFVNASSSPGSATLTLDEPAISLNGSPFNPLLLGSGAHFSAVVDQLFGKAVVDATTGNAEFAGQLINRFPGIVSRDVVRNVRNFNYSGHVYDLQTVDGWYSGNGIIIHNCRCHVGWRVIGRRQGKWLPGFVGAAKSISFAGSRWQCRGKAKAFCATGEGGGIDNSCGYGNGGMAAGASSRTPQFKAWFGSSTVVDEQGEPLVMYHASSKQFDAFRPNTHFGTAQAANDRASNLIEFSTETVGRAADTESVYPVYLKVENPLRMPDLASVDTYSGLPMEEAIENYKAKHDDWSEEDGEYPRPAAWESETDLSEWLYRNDVISQDEFWEVQYDPDKALDLLKEKGYDGIVYRNDVEDAGSDSYIVFDPANIKSALANSTFDPKDKRHTKTVSFGGSLTKAFDPNQPRDERGRWTDTGGSSIADNIHLEEKEPAREPRSLADKFRSKQEKTPKFKKWFGKSKVTDDKGRPLMLYHGTTQEFDQFDLSRANPESNMGAGAYFTNNRNEVGANYAGDGPDLKQRMELEIERREQEEEYNDNEEKKTRDEIEAEVRAEYMPHGGATMPVYLRMENPFVIGGKDSTRLDYESGFNPESEDYDQEPSGKAMEFIENLRNQASRYDAGDVEGIAEKIMQSAMDYEGITAHELDKIIREDEQFNYYTDENGRLVSTEIYRSALEATGFDGVIDNTVNRKFGTQNQFAGRGNNGMEGMNPDTTHYIAFSPTQIKSAIGNSGEFDPNDPDIRKSVSFAGSLTKNCGAGEPGSPGFQTGNTCWQSNADVPDAPGSRPLPADHIRLYHYSNKHTVEEGQNVDDVVHGVAESLRTQGIMMSRSRGGITGEPSLIWASTRKPSDEHVYVEFSVHRDDPRISHLANYPQARQSVDDFQAGENHVTFASDIKPADIIAVHEPWHAKARYLQSNPDLIEQAKRGELDHTLELQGYGPATKAAKAGRLDKSISFKGSLAKNCGTGSGGFQPGNTCARGSGQTDSPAFKKWFSDSKVLGDDGKPLVVYHGTVSDEFHEFNTDRTKGNTSDPNAFLGAHFAATPTPANRFAEGLYADGENKGGRVYPAYLSIQNPLQIGAGSPPSAELARLESKLKQADDALNKHSIARIDENKDALDAAIMSGDDDKIDAALNDPKGDALYEETKRIRGEIYKLKDENRPIKESEVYHAVGMDYDKVSARLSSLHGKSRVAYAARVGREIKERLIKAGHDGVYYENAYEEETGIGAGDKGRDTYIVFDPKQIKSATGNAGTFDPNDADIRRSISFGGSLTKNCGTGAGGFQHGNTCARGGGQVDTPEFKQWFSGSKVTTDDGSPIVLYHGTNAPDFSVFKNPFNPGEFFSSTPAMSNALAHGKNGRIYSVFVRMKNPLDLRDLGQDADSKNLAEVLGKHGLRYPDEPMNRYAQSTFSHVNDLRRDREWLREFKDRGFDGIIFTDTDPSNGGKSDSYVVFDAKQIKSATGNAGTFNPNDPDIRRSISFAGGSLVKNCGTGAGGFQPGNTCARGGDGGTAVLDRDARHQTDSPEFHKWFAGSKIVDDEGKPLIAYHGSQKAFHEFRSMRMTDVYKLGGKEIVKANSWDMGDDSKGMPEGYHYGAVSDALTMGADKALEFRLREHEHLNELYVADGKPPRPMSPGTQRHIDDLKRLAAGELKVTKELRPTQDGFYFTPSLGYSFVRDIGDLPGGQVYPVYLSIKNPIHLNSAEIESAGQEWRVEKYKQQGYDGAIYHNKSPNMQGGGWNGESQIVAFYPEQIKSAIGNSGEFDVNDPDIRKSVSFAGSLTKNCGTSEPGDPGFKIGNTCAKGDGGGGTAVAESKEQSEPQESGRKEGASERARREIKEAAAKVRFSEVEYHEGDTGGGWSTLSDIEDAMTDRERDRMQEAISEQVMESVNESADEADIEIDSKEVADDAGWSNSDVNNKVEELIDEHVTDEAAREELHAARENWYASGNSYGTEALDEIIAGQFQTKTGYDTSKLVVALDELRSEAASEIEDAEMSARDSARERYIEDLYSSYDDSDERRRYLQDWAAENADRFVGEESDHEDKAWQRDAAGNDVYHFSISNGQSYHIDSQPMTRGRAALALTDAISGDNLRLVSFHNDSSDSYEVTGTGGAKEVFSNVVPALVAYVDKYKPDAVYFTAAKEEEKEGNLRTNSRQKLYDRLVKSTAGALPEYFAIATSEKFSTDVRGYVVGKREHKDKIIEELTKRDPEVAVIVKSLVPVVYSHLWDRKAFERGSGRLELRKAVSFSGGLTKSVVSFA